MASKAVTDGLQITGTSLQAFGSYMANAEEARGLKINAREVLREGKRAAARVRELGERVSSSQRVGFVKGGVELSGTVLEVLAETVNIAERDALEIERVAARQARELRRAARRKKRAGVGGVVGTVVGAAIGGPTGAQIGSQVGASIGGNT